jgi:DNA repair protein RadB
MAQLQSGIACLDSRLGGGLNPGAIMVLYGEPETGKTTLTLQYAANCAVGGQKVLFVDCDNTFSTERLTQIARNSFDAVAERIVLVKPRDFREQTAFIDQIQDYTANVGLIVIDTFTSLYSARAAETAKAFTVNRELNRQLALIAQIAKIKKIPVIIISQVRSVISEQNSGVRPVATRVLKFWADIIVALQPTQLPQTMKVIVEKPAGNEKDLPCYVQIGEAGLKDTQFPLNG